MATLAARFPHLKSYLSSPTNASGELNFEQLLGFLYAVSSAPDVIDASEWLNFVFCDRAARQETDEARRAVLEALDLHHVITCEVLGCTIELPPDCVPRPEVLANLDPECGLSRWSQGFSVGHDWLEETWEASVRAEVDEDLDWQLGGCMAVLCFFSSREMAQALHAEFKTDARSLEDRARIMLDLLPEALKAYADIGRSLAAGMADEEDTDGYGESDVADEVRVCSCGSGRPHRLCCGSSRLVH